MVKNINNINTRGRYIHTMTVTWIPVMILTAADVAAQQSVCRISALPPIVATSRRRRNFKLRNRSTRPRRFLNNNIYPFPPSPLPLPVIVDDERRRWRGEIGRTRAHARRPKSPNDRTVVLTFSPRRSPQTVVVRPVLPTYRMLVECYVLLRVERQHRHQQSRCKVHEYW